MTTDRLSPLAVTAPAAAVAVVLVTGWAVAQADDQAESAATPVQTGTVETASQRANGSEERVLQRAIKAERAEVRHLEKALDRARKRLAAEQRSSTVVVAAAPAAPSTWGSSGSGSSGASGSGGSGASGSGGSGASGSGGSGGGSTSSAPSTNTTTSGS